MTAAVVAFASSNTRECSLVTSIMSAKNQFDKMQSLCSSQDISLGSYPSKLHTPSMYAFMLDVIYYVTLPLLAYNLLFLVRSM